MIAKTHLISQLTYLMGSLPVGKIILDRANEVIISFVNEKERKIAANRHFLPRERGGVWDNPSPHPPQGAGDTK